MFMIRHCVYLFAILLCGFIASLQTYAQSLTAYGVRVSFFPSVIANFSARDVNNKQISTLSPSDFSVKENGIDRKVIRVSCPQDQSPSIISSVLVMDISGSMYNGSPQTNMDLAKEAGKWWVNALPNDGSECAVTSFDHDSYINQDFTASKQKLKSAIDALSPIGSTNYNAGFIDGPGSGLSVMDRAKYKRVLIFLTDGMGTANEAAIISQANQKNTTVFCVGVRLPIPEALKNIASQTNGLWFENVNSPEEIVEVYDIILRKAIDGKPCEIEWETEMSCTPKRTAVISVPALSISDSVTFLLPSQDLPGISPSSYSVRFTDIAPGNSDTKYVDITATSNNVIIDNIVSNNPEFVIIPSANFPWNLNKGDTKSFGVRFIPTDSMLTFSQIKVLGNICVNSTLYAAGGYPGKRKKELKLMVSKPNGGEVFIAGDTTTLEWNGVLPTDTVRLDYSTDNGTTWLPIIDKIMGFKYLWKVPETPSNNCLLRARLLAPTKTDSVVFLEGHTGIVHEACFSPDGARAATVSEDRTLRIWDTESGGEITNAISLNFKRPSAGKTVSWSSGGNFIAAAGDMGAALFDAVTFTKLHDFEHPFAQDIETGLFTPDDNYYVVAGMQSNIIIWSVANPTVFGAGSSSHTDIINRLTLKEYSEINNNIELNLLSASKDKTAKIVEFRAVKSPTFISISSFLNNTFPPFATEDSKVAHIQHPDFSETRLAASNNGVIFKHPEGTRTDISKGNINDIEYSPDGKHIAVAFNSGELAVLNSATLAVERSLDRNIASAFSVRWDTYGSRIIASYANNVALIWEVADVIMQEDMSDHVWSIVSPEIEQIKDIDLGTLPVLTSRDSIIKAVLCYKNHLKKGASVDSAKIVNDPENNFDIVSGVPTLFGDQLPSCVFVELRFSPKTIGMKNAILRLYSGGKAFDIMLRGIGVDIALYYFDKIIDFGRVPVGLWKDSLVTPIVKNESKMQTRITSSRIVLPGIEHFSIIGGDTTIILQYNQLQTLQLRFEPKDIGRTSARVRIVFMREGAMPTVGSPVYVTLLGEGICSGIDTSKTVITGFGQKTMSVITGRRVNIPIVVKTQAGVNNRELPRKFSGQISFNAGLLYPRNEPRGIVENGRRKITFSGIRNIDSDTLTTFSMLTLFGDNDRTEINVDTLYFSDGCPTLVKQDNIMVVFTDICEAGGEKRLITNAPKTGAAISPNIVSGNELTVSISLTENTYTTISLINPLGEQVAVQCFSHLNSGTHDIPFVLSGLVSGLYTVVIRTRSEFTQTQFIKW